MISDPVPGLARASGLRFLAPPPITRALVVGLAVTLVATVLRIGLEPFVSHGFPFLTYYPGIAVAAWSGGLAAGVTALVASAIVADLLFLVPLGTLAANDSVSLVVFAVSGILISVLGGELHRSRGDAREAAGRAAFLADASAVLNERLDRLATIESLARLAVPRIADFCAIDLFDDANRWIDARIAARDQAKVELAFELRRRYPYAPDASMGVSAVARTGRPEYTLDMPSSFFEVIPDAKLRSLMQGLGFRSFISVALAVPDGRTLGVLTVVMAESGRRYEAVDVETIADLGRRAGVALDHASLFGEVRARRDELDSVIRVITEPVLVGGADGAVELENVAARGVLGDVVGRDLDAVIAGLAPVPDRPQVRRTPAGRYLAPTVIDVDTSAPGIRVAVLHDVTEVLESETARDAFVGMLSHELRTPITTVYGMAALLRRSLADESRIEIVADLAAETDRLYRLVEDLLVLSRFERGRLEVAGEPVLVQRVANSILDRATQEHPHLRVEVQAGGALPPAVADPTYLEQVLRNLVSNTVKYAGDDAHVFVRIADRDGMIRVEFEDDGPGIPVQEAERVFGLYERLAKNALVPGAGIGLFVCRRLVEAMGGEITVSRGTLGGACFVFTLPVVADERPSEEGGGGGATGDSAGLGRLLEPTAQAEAGVQA